MRPLSTGGLPPRAPGAPPPRPGEPDPELVQRAEEQLEKLAERVELLERACRDAGLPLPGVEARPPRFALTPTSQQVLAYMVPQLQRDERLARAVQVAVYRFQEVARAVCWRMERTHAPVDIEVLRRHVFYLTNLSAEFRSDAVLAVIFPPPDPAQAHAAMAALQPAEARRPTTVRKEVVDKASEQVQRLEPKFWVVEKALASVEQGLGHHMQDFFSPQGRQAKVLALALMGDGPILARLRATCAQYQAMVALLPKLSSGEAGLDDMRPLVLALGRLGLTYQDHPLLAELFGAPPTQRLRRQEPTV